jgi:hypothetical protein
MTVKWSPTGDSSKKLQQQFEQEKQMQEAQQGKMWRFWLNKGEEGQFTFVDGVVDSQGFLEAPRFWEHTCYMNGSWNNHFICPEKTMPNSGYKCPICASDNKPYFAVAFTVIDHREFKRKNGSVASNTAKLFVAKSQTYEILAKKAAKYEGLAGVRFEASRMGDKSPAVGSMFEYVAKHPVAELKKLYQKEVVIGASKQQVTAFEPADYEKEFEFFTPEELITKCGFSAGTGGFQTVQSTLIAGADKFSDHL